MAFTPGPGGGSSSIAGSSDVSLDNVEDDQVLSYSASSSKWQNKQVPSGGTSSIYEMTGNVVVYSTSPTSRPTDNADIVVIFITPTEPTVMLDNDVWLSDLGV